MKISASGGGGFAGQTAHVDVDTATAANGKSIEALVRDIGFFTRQPPAAPVGADLMHWTITVTDGPTRHSVTFVDDGSAEAVPWQALLAQLRAA